jgi:hypothetical protein
MEETLKIIGVNTEVLNSKPIHSRIETERILGCTNQTLNTFQRKGWIKPSRFKNKNYYSTSSIIECIKFQLGEYSDIQITNQNKEWETMWV